LSLNHFSEEPDIRVFEPRPLAVPSLRPPGREWLNGPLVWAIDDWHAPMYYFPRDCPRIVTWPLPATTAADREKWWGARDGTRMVAHLEWAWFERVRATTLYRYVLPAEGYESLDDVPGAHVNRRTVIPDRIEAIPDLLGALRDADVEVRFMPSLLPLKGAWDSTMHVSGNRLRNAEGWR